MSQNDQNTSDGSEARVQDPTHVHGHWGVHDHALGQHGHIHGDEHADPWHSHPDEMEQVGNQFEITRLTITSVGIDVGSSTSHITFSRLVLQRQGFALSSRFKVVEREIIHQSPILLTPYADPRTIDSRELDLFIKGAYADAGITVDDVDTGALIFTGEAAKKHNAEAISGIFAEQAGKFVSVVAGPNLEAVLAAFGSGACARSGRRDDGAGQTVLNIDIGGGTTKFAICQDGEVVDTAATNVGARLIAWDETGKIFRIEPAGQIIAENLGILAELGGTLPEAQQRLMAEFLAECLYDVTERRPLDGIADRLMITPPLRYDGHLDAVVFSGGVSEYVYGREPRNFGDLGILLGQAVWDRRQRLGTAIERPLEGIRATVIGAGQYTLQVTGSTIFVTRPDLLPHRNLPVVAPIMPADDYTPVTVKDSIQQALARLDIEEGAPFALSFRWNIEPSYERVKTLAEGVVLALPQTIAQGLPITLVFDRDIGSAVGNLLSRELIPGHDIVSIDEVQVGDLDFIDVAEKREDIRAVPVIVKSLVFTTPRQREAGLVAPVSRRDT